MNEIIQYEQLTGFLEKASLFEIYRISIVIDRVKELKDKWGGAKGEKERIEGEVAQREELIASKKRELKDEEKGAKKVNEYLNNFFGHQFLTLEAKKIIACLKNDMDQFNTLLKSVGELVMTEAKT